MEFSNIIIFLVNFLQQLFIIVLLFVSLVYNVYKGNKGILFAEKYFKIKYRYFLFTKNRTARCLGIKQWSGCF